MSITVWCNNRDVPATELLLQVCMQVGQPIIMWGPDGEAKSELVEGYARSLKYGFYRFIGSTADPTDIGGVPVKVEDPDTGEPYVFRIPNKVFHAAMESGKKGIPFVIMFDEMNTCPPAVLAALLNVLTGFQAGDVFLPRETTRFVAAANPPSIAVNPTDLGVPTCTRLTHVNHLLDPQTWVNGLLNGFQDPPATFLPKDWSTRTPEMYALLAGFQQRTRFLYMREEAKPQHVNLPRAVPRSWTNLCHVLAGLEGLGFPKSSKDGEQEDAGGLLVMQNLAAEGTIGQGCATEFLEFLRMRDKVDIDKALADPTSYELPGDETPDLQYLFANLLSAEMRARGQDLKSYKATWELLARAKRGGWGDIAGPAAYSLSSLLNGWGAAVKALKNGELPGFGAYLSMVSAIAQFDSE